MGSEYFEKYMTQEGFDFPRLLNDDFFKPVKLLYNHQHFVSATKLLLNFIDAAGFIDFGDTGENTFVKWLDTYADLTALGITAEEFWEHRNALLHMSNLESRKIRSGKVKRIAWYVGTLPSGLPLSDPNYKFYNLLGLIEALGNACNRWSDSYNRDRDKFPEFLDRYDMVVSDSRPGLVEIKEGIQ